VPYYVKFIFSTLFVYRIEGNSVVFRRWVQLIELARAVLRIKIFKFNTFLFRFRIKILSRLYIMTRNQIHETNCIVYNFIKKNINRTAYLTVKYISIITWNHNRITFKITDTQHDFLQVLPIENSMRHPQRFLKARPCGVLNAAMVLVVCLYSVAGFLGYLRFGDATDGSITLNLPNDLYV